LIKAKKLVPLLRHPKWKAFAKRYAHDPERFAREAQGIYLSEQQEDLAALIAAPGSRVAVPSGHGTGKTTSIANLCVWHLTTYALSGTLLTANDMDQMKATVWKEIALAVGRIKQGPHAWIADYIEVLADGTARIRGYEAEWFIEAKTANEKNANKMAGRHGKRLLIIADEASTIPDAVLTTLAGALSSGSGNRMLMTSQPTRTAGYFYRACHELNALQPRGIWTVLTLSSVDSPWVEEEALIEWWNTFDEDERLVRILGQFPTDSAKYMMGRRVAESMYTRGRIIDDSEPWGWIVLSDVALGEGLRDKSATVACRIIGHGEERRVEVVEIPLFSNAVRSTVLPGHIIEAGARLTNPTYAVDAGGIGGTTCQAMEDRGIPVHRILWGNPCFRKRNKERYINLRAQAMHQAAMAAKDGRLSILTPRYKKFVIDQSSRIPRAFTDRALIKVPPKGSSEWDGMGSPDLWDAICFAFLEGLDYMPAGSSGDAQDDGIDEATMQALDDLDDWLDDDEPEEDAEALGKSSRLGGAWLATMVLNQSGPPHEFNYRPY